MDVVTVEPRNRAEFCRPNPFPEPDIPSGPLDQRIENAVAFLAPLVGSSDLPPPSGNAPGSS